jgi:hypothetical protein
MSYVGIIPRVLGVTDIAERQEGMQGRAPATFFPKKKRYAAAGSLLACYSSSCKGWQM